MDCGEVGGRDEEGERRCRTAILDHGSYFCSKLKGCGFSETDRMSLVRIMIDVLGLTTQTTPERILCPFPVPEADGPPSCRVIHAIFPRSTKDSGILWESSPRIP